MVGCARERLHGAAKMRKNSFVPKGTLSTQTIFIAWNKFQLTILILVSILPST